MSTIFTGYPSVNQLQATIKKANPQNKGIEVGHIDKEHSTPDYSNTPELFKIWRSGQDLAIHQEASSFASNLLSNLR